jgi:hypothetical protein
LKEFQQAGIGHENDDIFKNALSKKGLEYF